MFNVPAHATTSLEISLFPVVKMNTTRSPVARKTAFATSSDSPMALCSRSVR